MNKKRAALLILIALLAFGWYKLFYKTYSVKYIPANVDAIITIDKKRVINTLLWQFITTPSQWKFSSSDSKKDSTISWKKVIELPDYITAFHITTQPNNAWHTCLPIKNHVKITYFLQQQGFKNISGNEFVHEGNNLFATIKEGMLVISSIATADKNLQTSVIESLFTTKKTITEAQFKKLTTAKSHVAGLFLQNNFLQEDAIVKANFDKQKIEILTTLLPKQQFIFTENNFTFSSSSLLNFQFSQPNAATYNLLDNITKEKISKALNFNADSFFLPSNKTYQLQADKFINRVDSAISYTYDDEFNKIEKVVVNNVQEPVYNFTVTGDSVNNIYNNWQKNKLLETTPQGNLFTPIPFVKSYATVSGNQLIVQPYNYKATSSNANFKGIAYMQLNIADVPANLLNYLPDEFKKGIANLQNLVITAEQKEKTVEVKVVVGKKKNDLPIIKL
ncbi:MAG: hypothetical protein KA319_07230 [Ferruginibacter sp.]|nr:hypothetical protein [Ferruginibacter sp.]